MTAAIIYHANCPDGWTAAWVAYNARKCAEDIPDLIPASHGIPPADVTGYDEVYIVDFSYPHRTLAEMAEGRRVVVLDHHQTAVDDICSHHGDYPGRSSPWGDGSRGGKWIARYAEPYETVLDTNRSGAGITWDYFHPGQPRPDIVNYVEDRDLWRFALPRSQEVNAYIRSQPHSLGAWDDINQYLTVDAMANAGTGVLAHIYAYARAAADHAYWCRMGDRVFPIVNITYEACSEVAAHLLEKFDTDMAGYFFETATGRWQYGFRSRNGVTVHGHATQFGGGGHPQAAGCTLDEITHIRIDTPEAGQQDDEGTINELRQQVQQLKARNGAIQDGLDELTAAGIHAEAVNWANVRALLDRLDEEIGHPDD